jgi:hypothetical protein
MALARASSPSRVDSSRLFGEDNTVAMCMWSACSISELPSVCPLLASQPRILSQKALQKTVKWEEVYRHHYQTLRRRQPRLQTFLEDVYNAKRLHSSLDDVPHEFELKYSMCSCLNGLDFLGHYSCVRINFAVRTNRKTPKYIYWVTKYSGS